MRLTSKNLRQHLDLAVIRYGSRSALARLLGIPKATVNSWFTRSGSIRLENLEKLERFLSRAKG